MQYKIPQEIATEDRLINIGPAGLSLRQLIICGIGGGFSYLIFISLARVADPIVYVPPMAVIMILTLAIAFFKKDNLTFTRMLLLFIEMVINPPKRMWVNMGGDLSPFDLLESMVKKETPADQDKNVTLNNNQVQNISKIISILDYNDNDRIQEDNAQKLDSILHEHDPHRTSFLEQLAAQAAQQASTGKQKNDAPAELPTENLYIKQEEQPLL